MATKFSAFTKATATDNARDYIAGYTDTNGAGAFENRAFPLSLLSQVPADFDFIITQGGAGYQAIDGLTKEVVQDNVSFDVVIQAVMDQEPLRTAPRSISIVGAVSIDVAIEIPNYTYIFGPGTITCPLAGVRSVRNKDFVGGNNNIQIGGRLVIDAQAVDDSTNQSGIWFENVTNSVVAGVVIRNVGVHGINLKSCFDIRITGCDISNFGDDGISVLQTQGFSISGSYIHGAPLRGASDAVGSSAIEIEDDSLGGVVANNIISDIYYLAVTGSQAAGNGIHCIVDDTADNRTLRNIVITGNTIKNVAYGITNQQNDSTASLFKSMVVSGNTISDCKKAGINIKAVQGGVYSDNSISDTVEPGINASNSNGCIIANNTIDTTGDHGVSLFAGSNWKVSNNTFSDVGALAAANKDAISLNTCDGAVVSGTNCQGGTPNYLNRIINFVSTTGLLFAHGNTAVGINEAGTGIRDSGTIDPVIGDPAAADTFTPTNVSAAP